MLELIGKIYMGPFVERSAITLPGRGREGYKKREDVKKKCAGREQFALLLKKLYSEL